MKSTFKRVLLSIANVGLLTVYGCGGGGGGSTIEAVQPSPTPTITFTGVVATGAPARGAEVSIEGSDTMAITDDDGNYTITVPAILKPPYIFNATFFQSGVGKNLKSIVMEEGGGLKKIANITPVTDTITSFLLDHHKREGTPEDRRELPVNLGLYKTAKEVFKGILRDAGCTICGSDSYDPISTPFKADPTTDVVDRTLENIKSSYTNGVAVFRDNIGNNLALLPYSKIVSGSARTDDSEVITPAELELAIVRRGPISVTSLDGDSCRMSGTLTRGEILNNVCVTPKPLCISPLVAVNGVCVNTGQAVTLSPIQAAYDQCFDSTSDLYTATYCEAYARVRASGSTAIAANEVGAAAAGSNVGNIGTGQTISSTGTLGPFSGTLSTAQAAFNECYYGTPDFYSSLYCAAYARARASGSTAAAANVAGSVAAISNVGNIGTGQPISSTGTSSPIQAAYDQCYVGTPDLYSSTYCEAYARAIASGSTATAANRTAARAAGSNVGNIGTGEPISSTGTSLSSNSTNSGTSTTTNVCPTGYTMNQSSKQCVRTSTSTSTANSGSGSNTMPRLLPGQGSGSGSSSSGSGRNYSGTPCTTFGCTIAR